VWRDADQDGVAAPGEMISLAATGVARIAVRGDAATPLACRRGLELRDGTSLPTFDWTAHRTPLSLRTAFNAPSR